MKFFLLTLFSVVTVTYAIWSISLDMEPDIHPCMPDKKFHVLDCSDLKFISDPKTAKVYMNGTLKALKEFGGKLTVNFTTKRFTRGRWIDGEVDFLTYDFCSYMSNPLKQPIVYKLFHTAFKKKSCPFPAGHTETLNMVSWTDFPMICPPNYIDQWKGYSKFYDENGTLIECHMAEGEIFG